MFVNGTSRKVIGHLPVIAGSIIPENDISTWQPTGKKALILPGMSPGDIIDFL
jgi:hypothetical protein